MVQYQGFVSGEKKNQLFREADLFCFPTYYENENQPVNLIEAMAFGLPILTTRWRSLPELFPADYPGLVNVRSPEQLADRLLALVTIETGEGFRDIFLRSFTLERHLAGLAEAFTQVESAPASALAAAAAGTGPEVGPLPCLTAREMGVCSMMNAFGAAHGPRASSPMKRRRFNWILSDVIRECLRRYLEWSARLKGQRFYCRSLGGESDTT